MMVSEFLHESTVRVGLEARNKTAAIEELVDVLVEEHEISVASRADIIQIVLDREKMMSTGMEQGVAIPHGATDVVDDVIAAFGVSHEGIDFHSVDGRLAHIVILLILPVNEYSAGVKTMSGITKILTHEGLRKRIVDASTASEVIDVLIEEEERRHLA